MVLQVENYIQISANLLSGKFEEEILVKGLLLDRVTSPSFSRTFPPFWDVKNASVVGHLYRQNV